MRALVQVYALRLDHDHVAKVQAATLGRGDAGLLPEPHLYGSPEWWSMVETGEIQVHTVRGSISKVFMSGHNDYPEFEIDQAGVKTRWTRETSEVPDSPFTRNQLAELYQPGAEVQLLYVLQRFKKPLKVLGEHSRCVIEIWLAPAARARL